MIDYITGPDPEFTFNYTRLVMFFILPVLVMIFSVIFWFARSICARQTMQEKIDKTVSTIAIVWFLFYPTIVSYLASSINCTSIEGTPRLYDDLEEVCYEGRHLKVIYSISIPGLLLWAFGIPFLGLYLIRRSRRVLQAAEFNSDPVIYKNLSARMSLRLGFLT